MANGFLHIDVKQTSHVVFDRRVVRKAFVTVGQEHMAVARRLISREGGSKAGENPGRVQGILSQSVGYYVPNASGSRPGFMVRIAPNQRRGRGQTASIVGAFYPAFLLHGVRNGAKRKKSHHRGISGGSGWRIAPRNNFMIEALDNLTPWTRYILSKALTRSLHTEKGAG